jgi:hypothetical protein
VISTRLRSAAKAALVHLSISLVTAVLLGWLMLKVWYPAPFDLLTTGRDLLLLVVVVDVVCGPLLTLVLFNPQKSKMKWRIDLSLIVAVQLAALGYGIFQAAAVRPVFMAFEGDRFRVVLASDIQKQLADAPPELKTIGYSGPKLIAAKLMRPNEKGYPESVQLSMSGVHPAFRPGRWQTYAEQTSDVIANLKPLTNLSKRPPAELEKLNEAVANTGLSANAIGYLPVVNDTMTDWIVLIAKNDARPLAYLHIDGW